MKRLSVITALLTLVVSIGLAQVPDPTSSLSPYVFGLGGEWDRGSSAPIGIDVTFAANLSKTSFYWWSNAETPAHKGANGPTPSVLSTGMGWIANPADRVKLVIITQAGASISSSQIAASAGSGAAQVAAAFSGSFGVSIPISGDVSLFAFVKALATGATTTGATGVSTVVQPGIEVMYGAHPKGATPMLQPSVKAMRAVMRRLHLPEGDIR